MQRVGLDWWKGWLAAGFTLTVPLAACERGGDERPSERTVMARPLRASMDAGTTARAAAPGGRAPLPTSPASRRAPPRRRELLGAEALASRARGVGPRCVSGWVTPRRGTALRQAPLDEIRRRPGDRFLVSQMRYFVGPDDADVVSPEAEVERWYVKARVVGLPHSGARYLVRRSSSGTSIDAIAPYASAGFGPGIWERPDAPHESLADPFQVPCRKADQTRCTGLPYSLLGCLR